MEILTQHMASPSYPVFRRGTGTQGGLKGTRQPVLLGPCTTTRQSARLGAAPLQVHASSRDVSPHVSRRQVTQAFPAAYFLTGLFAELPACAESEATETPLLVFEPVENERFAPLEATFELAPSWKSRPGQKPKSNKLLLYTDTYGPNYKYSRVWPRYTDEEGKAVQSVQMVVQGLSGLDVITDLGEQDNVVVQKAFGIESDDLMSGEIASQSSRKDAAGQVYYEWELSTPEEGRVLVSASLSGGGLYVLCLTANSAQWTRGGDDMKKMVQSFRVATGEESSADTSSRIFNVRKGDNFDTQTSFFE